MNKIVRAVTILMFLLSGCTYITHNHDILPAHNPSHNAYNSVVILSATSEDNQPSVVASGFAYDENRIATAAHFCVAALELKILHQHTINAHQTINGHKIEFGGLEVEEMSEVSDVCLIRAEKHMIPPLPIVENYDTDVHTRDDIVIVGAPMGVAVGEFYGKVMTLYYDGPGPEILQGKLTVSAASTGGVSGSPIILKDTGEVIGILVMGHKSFDHLSFGTPIKELLKIAK